MIDHSSTAPKNNVCNAWFLVALFLLALSLRCVRTDLMEFKHDEAVAWVRSEALLKGIEFPCAGLMSSKGVENFPLFLYILAALQLIFRRPQFVVCGIAFLNSAAIFFLWSSVRRLFDFRTARLTCILYAVSPCAVFFSRKIWAQDLLPFFVLLMFYCAALLVTGADTKKKERIILLLAFQAGIVWQIHFAALLPAGVYLIITFMHRRSVRPIFAVSGTLAGLIPACPYFFRYFTDLERSPGGLQQIASFGSRFHLKETLNYFVRQVVDEGFYAYLGPDYTSFVASIPGYSALRYVLSALVVIGLAICLSRGLRGNPERRRAYGLLLLPTVLALSVIIVSRSPLVPSYFIIFYPMPFLFAAITITCVWNNLSKRLKARATSAAMCLLVGIIIAYQLIYSISFMRKVNKDGGTRGDYGVAYSETRKAVQWFIDSGFAADDLQSQELAFIAAYTAISTDPPHVATLTPEEQKSERKAAFINRLVHPDLDKETARWIVKRANGFFYLSVPPKAALETFSAYPRPILTTRQRREEEHAKQIVDSILALTGYGE